MSVLLLDIGNSRLKWGVTENGRLGNVGATLRDGAPPVPAADAWLPVFSPARIIAANVAGNNYAARLSGWCEKQWGVPIEYIHVDAGLAGVELAYSKAQNFGVDRWLALIAAQQLTAGNVCVIDCGTAVTIDLLTAQGKHQGGVILPGLWLMKSSLLKNTDGIEHAASASLPADKYLLGCNTRDGVIKGTMNAVVGAIEYTVTKIKRDMAMPVTCIVTGGDAAEILTVLGQDYQHEPNLVLLGMQTLIAK